MAQTTKIKLINNKLDLIQLFLQIFLILVILFNVGNTVWNIRSKYLSTNYWQNFKSLEKVYSVSQYVSKHPTAFIPDETINSYAGAKYVKGENPILIAADTPPLGRYLIGLSIIIFNNDSTVVLITAVLSLVLVFIIGKQIFSNSLISLIPPTLLSFEPIFKNQLIYSPLLDIFQLLFLLFCFYFFNKGLSSKKSLLFFILANIFLGFFIATKFFITGFVIIAAWYIVLLISKDKTRLVHVTISLPVSLIVLLLSYIRVFAFGYTLSKFLGIQKYVFLYHKSQLILPFSIWPLILLNRWYVWYGNKPVISDPQWQITWPIITIFSAITFILYTLKKIPKNKNLEVLMLWSLFYFLFFSAGQISTRYFVILIPVLYIIFVYGLVSIYKLFKK